MNVTLQSKSADINSAALYNQTLQNEQKHAATLVIGVLNCDCAAKQPTVRLREMKTP